MVKHANFQLYRTHPGSYLENMELGDKFVNKRVRLFLDQIMCLSKTFEKKKKIRTAEQGHFFRNNSLYEIMQLFNYFQNNAEAATGEVL